MNHWLAIVVLLGVNALLFAVPEPKGLTVSFFDVGQGDAIFIEGPTGVQVLVDTGPDSKVLRELGKWMPFWDKSIDALVLTHPDADHIGGAPDILERYQVGLIIEPGVGHTTQLWQTTINAMTEEIESGAGHTTARRGQRLNLGGGAYAEVLYPTSNVEQVKDTNAASIVLRVVYGKTAFMLTGDAPSGVEQELFLKYGYGLNADVLKAGHHGSHTSSLPDFVESVSPTDVVFSRGCDNRYGHPATTVVAYYESQKIKTHDTCEEGSISYLSYGQEVHLQRASGLAGLW